MCVHSHLFHADISGQWGGLCSDHWTMVLMRRSLHICSSILCHFCVSAPNINLVYNLAVNVALIMHFWWLGQAKRVLCPLALLLSVVNEMDLLHTRLSLHLIWITCWPSARSQKVISCCHSVTPRNILFVTQRFGHYCCLPLSYGRDEAIDRRVEI